jgi:hypothetical protein
LRGYANLVLRTYSDYLSTSYIDGSRVYFNRKSPLECPLCHRKHDKDQRWHGFIRDGSFFVRCFRQDKHEPSKVFNIEGVAEKAQKQNKDNTDLQKPKGPCFPKPFLTMPAWVKCDSPLTATEVYKEKYVRPLPEKGDIYVGSPWETGKTYTLEHITVPEGVNVLMLSTRHTFSNAVSKRLNLVSYLDIDGDIVFQIIKE